MSDSETAARVKNSQSKSFRKLNPHLFQVGGSAILNHGHEDDEELEHIAALTAKQKPKKRIRQSDKPLLNRLEGEWWNHLTKYLGYLSVRPQGIKLKLANGAFYKPDFFCPVRLIAWEVKELKGKNADRGKLALKFAATAWPEIKFLLIWKENGEWQEQHVLP